MHKKLRFCYVTESHPYILTHGSIIVYKDCIAENAQENHGDDDNDDDTQKQHGIIFGYYETTT